MKNLGYHEKINPWDSLLLYMYGAPLWEILGEKTAFSEARYHFTTKTALRLIIETYEHMKIPEKYINNNIIGLLNENTHDSLQL